MGRGTLRLLRSTFPAPLALACDRIFDCGRTDPSPAVFIACALFLGKLGCVAWVRGSLAWGGVLCACFDQPFLPLLPSPATEFSTAGEPTPAPPSSSLAPCSWVSLGVLLGCGVPWHGAGYFAPASINLSCPSCPRLRPNFRLRANRPQPRRLHRLRLVLG